MSMAAWPLGKRPREKLLHQGAASLSDAELLAVFSKLAPRARPNWILPETS